MLLAAPCDYYTIKFLVLLSNDIAPSIPSILLVAALPQNDGDADKTRRDNDKCDSSAAAAVHPRCST